MVSRTLVILARTPEPHHTKTRLIPSLGSAGALQAHVELVEDTLERLAVMIEADVNVVLCVTQADNRAQAWAASHACTLQEQLAGDLGERMHHALGRALAQGADRACLVGTDCPTIDATYVQDAFTVLESADVVLGPAEDGGYGLVGLKAACRGLFTGVSWGSDQVLSQTLANASRNGLMVACLDEIWDVDTPGDWRRYLLWKAAGH